MPGGRPPAYAKPIREAFLRAVFEEGIPYTRAAAMLRAGELEDVGPVPVSTSTARGWRDKYLRDQASAAMPDEAAWRFIADETIRALSRETEKLTRDARKPKALDPKRLREHVAAVKDARGLVAPKNTEGPDATTGSPLAVEPESLLETLARDQAHSKPSSAASDPPTPTPNTETDTPGSKAGEQERISESDTTSPVHVREAAQDRGQPLVA